MADEHEQEVQVPQGPRQQDPPQDNQGDPPPAEQHEAPPGPDGELERMKREFDELKQSVAALTQASVENQLSKFMMYASRPLSEFKNYEALELVESLQNMSHDRKHEKEAYYRLVYQTARSKVELPSEHFRSLLLRLIGDKDHEKVFDTVAKVEKQFNRRKARSQDHSVDPSPVSRRGGRPAIRCYYCNKIGHVKSVCYKRIADEKRANQKTEPK